MISMRRNKDESQGLSDLRRDLIFIGVELAGIQARIRDVSSRARTMCRVMELVVVPLLAVIALVVIHGHAA